MRDIRENGPYNMPSFILPIAFVGALIRMGDSITPWLSHLRAGHPEAAQRIWNRYFRRLVGLARKKLQGRRLGVADEEDVAISALDSFCRNARAGRFPQLTDTDCLWRFLVVITARKAARLLRDQGRQKRSGGRCAPTGPIVGESISSRTDFRDKTDDRNKQAKRNRLTNTVHERLSNARTRHERTPRDDFDRPLTNHPPCRLKPATQSSSDCGQSK
jgi:hypothetical protein